jgi:hypothetical protein
VRVLSLVVGSCSGVCFYSMVQLSRRQVIFLKQNLSELHWELRGWYGHLCLPPGPGELPEFLWVLDGKSVFESESRFKVATTRCQSDIPKAPLF